tara:strand:- start:7564 stop:8508 length:945 start_codon:yes stop_codon:yes gene_type:complete
MMKLFKYQIFTLSFAIFFSSAIFAAGLFDKEEGVLWEAGYNHVIKYDKQDSTSFGKNDHPVDLAEKDIIAALKSLEFKDKGLLSGETIDSVFSYRQIVLLGEYLAKGLKNAAPEQDIIFVLPGSSKSLLILTKRSFIAGRAFYKEGKLNIIIGEYDLTRNDAVEKVIDPSDKGRINYSFNHGKRSTKSNRFKGNIIGIPGVTQNSAKGKLRHDWLIIDVNLAAEAYMAKIKHEENPNLKQEQALQLEAAKMAKQRREMRAEMARMRKDMNKQNNAASTTRSIEERITTLDELLAKELISKDEYTVKRKEILNDI